MYDEKDWRTVRSEQGAGEKYSFGIRLQVAGVISKDEYTNEERTAMMVAVDKVKEELLAAAVAADPKEQQSAREERQSLLECFHPSVRLFDEPVPNGYTNDWYNRHRFWYIVTTYVGRIRIGWRKRVIHIDWSDSAIKHVDGRTLFTDFLNNTVDSTFIHAWSYEEATKIISRLMGQTPRSNR